MTVYAKTSAGIQSRKRVNEKRKINGKSKISDTKQGLRRNYGLTLEQYDRLFEKQNGVCAICGGTNKNGYRLFVDHDHETNKVRGLLCGGCNTLLGHAKENKTILRSAINYLGDY